MAKWWYWCIFLAICATAEAGVLETEMTMMPSMEEEFQLDNEINRRILASKKYISYSAMQRDSVFCSHRGVSYYNCQLGADANPYQRGCSAITRYSPNAH
ncbi:Protein RALF-like 33, partial [Mucuna pruriens]